MRTFAQKPKATQHIEPPKSKKPGRTFPGQSRNVHSILQLQRTIGNQAVQRLVQSNTEELEAGSATTASACFARDFSQIPVHTNVRPKVQPKLTISTPGDTHEQEANRVANQLMCISSLQQQGATTCSGGGSRCHAGQLSHQPRFLEEMRVQENDTRETTVPPIVYDVLRASGQPLDSVSRAYFESRTGHDFSQVRIHADSKAAESARAINAASYTAGFNIVFGDGKSPGKNALTAHELTHVIQQRTHAHQLVNKVQRQVITPIPTRWTLVRVEIAARLACLYLLIDEMRRQSSRYLRTACRDGNYLTSLVGVRYIPEDRADAFGHCWIACKGSQACGEESTRVAGESREIFREVMKFLTLGIWGHNSFEEDVFNQSYGRELARINPDGDCFDLSYQAVVNGALRFHGHTSAEDSARPRVYNCTDIRIHGHEYRQGWRTIPVEFLDIFGILKERVTTS